MRTQDHYSLPIEAMYNTSQIPTDFHSHLEYEIYYFHSGKCKLLIGDSIYELAPGNLILMNGMTLHYPSIDNRYEYCRTVVHFNPAFASGLLQPPFLVPLLLPFEKQTNRLISLKPEEQARIEPLLERLCFLRQREDALSHDRLILCFQELLLLIYEFANMPSYGQASPPKSIKHQNVQKLISYIEEHYREDLQLDDVAEYMHLNKHYLVKIFKETTGITLFHYLYQRRINQAKMLFTMHPDRSITETAFEVGFKYVSHFSLTFKKFTGQSPDDYRKGIARSFE
ncbi:AraC family transcriptional regulator [Paenibacillus glycanilyticus]|uniref:AraC family transcriptional regulator n=1 Tax=Paenibacillus glycanilyticus TaxID=126569 RepID=UPI00203B0C90|nr:AraC family transcriptional regulator [Paenibacillus glycanilyticus]MCM3629328.1 AraC family transcriptional regulator [Paenibacillus glycanilyticus]